VAADIEILLATKEGSWLKGQRIVTCVARKPASLLREIFGQVILVISGQSRMMYRYLGAKAGGDNLL
jgi:hypothetical protein